MALSVKPRAGNRSAQLVLSVLNKRINRRVATSIGSVKRGASTETGEGFNFKRGYSLDALAPEDRVRIISWLETPEPDEQRKVTLSEVAAKVDQVLARLEGVGRLPLQVEAPTTEHALDHGDPLTRLERALDCAMRALEEQVTVQVQAGVRLSKKAYVHSKPLTHGNRLDELQAWANLIGREKFEEFRATCQRLGLWKSQSASDSTAVADSE